MKLRALLLLPAIGSFALARGATACRSDSYRDAAGAGAREG